jgi:16S rRNA C1402 N4-methylase RsmH
MFCADYNKNILEKLKIQYVGKCFKSVLILDILKIQPGEIGLDATLGYGGHSLELLKKALPNGKLYATDVDAIELLKTKVSEQK